MGLVTSLGVALALVGGLWVVPALIFIGKEGGAMRQKTADGEY
jgi:predicted RND superfamily exporter protein